VHKSLFICIPSKFPFFTLKWLNTEKKKKKKKNRGLDNQKLDLHYECLEVIIFYFIPLFLKNTIKIQKPTNMLVGLKRTSNIRKANNDYTEQAEFETLSPFSFSFFDK
jgi:hypothetical protein